MLDVTFAGHVRHTVRPGDAFVLTLKNLDHRKMPAALDKAVHCDQSALLAVNNIIAPELVMRLHGTLDGPSLFHTAGAVGRAV